MAVKHPKAIGRVANIEASGSTNIFDEDNLITLLNRLVVNENTRIYCNATVMTQAEIRLKDKSNVNWSTEQGLGGVPFEMLKFRTMRVGTDAPDRMVTDANDDRITPVGSFLRKSKIDELPQLWNVLRGHMSLVGPRPERPEFVAQFNDSLPYYAERHYVKPGLTGWAQLCYPYGATERDTIEKLQFDLYYVKNHSILFDLAIILQTIEVVLWGKGAR